MGVRTRIIDDETYELIITTLRKGFTHNGVVIAPKEKIAMALVMERNLGMRISDILSLTMESFVREDGRYRLDIVEKKTGKHRGFVCPDEVYQMIKGYAYDKGIHPQAKLFPFTDRCVQKYLKLACEHLGLERIGTHSFRKAFAVSAYRKSRNSVELVRVLLQHSDLRSTQRYIGVDSEEVEKVLCDVVNIV